MPEDYRRDPTPEEAYNLQFGVGGEEYLRKLRAEVRPPNLLGGRKGQINRTEPKPGTGTGSSAKSWRRLTSFLAASVRLRGGLGPG